MNGKKIVAALVGAVLLSGAVGCQQNAPVESSSSHEASVFGISVPESSSDGTERESETDTSPASDTVSNTAESSLTDEEIVSRYLYPSRSSEGESSGEDSRRAIELPMVPITPAESSSDSSRPSGTSEASFSIDTSSFGEASGLPAPASSVPSSSSRPAESSVPSESRGEPVSETTESGITTDPDETEILR